MTNEQIKDRLLQLYKCKEDFSVIQTGKKSKKINGFYVPDTKEIFIHNGNFKDDNEIMFTAIHEFTHHYLMTEKNMKSAKSHSGIFWGTFYDFTDTAVKLKIYERKRSEKTNKLVDEIIELKKQMIELQKELGDKFEQLFKECNANNERVEDVMEHDCQISRKKVKEYVEMNRLKSEHMTDEMVKVISTIKDDYSRQQALKDINDGKNIEQIKKCWKKNKEKSINEKDRLLQEKNRLEKTIGQLTTRLDVVSQRIAEI